MVFNNWRRRREINKIRGMIGEDPQLAEQLLKEVYATCETPIDFFRIMPIGQPLWDKIEKARVDKEISDGKERVTKIFEDLVRGINGYNTRVEDLKTYLSIATEQAKALPEITLLDTIAGRVPREALELYTPGIRTSIEEAIKKLENEYNQIRETQVEYEKAKSEAIQHFSGRMDSFKKYRDKFRYARNKISEHPEIKIKDN